MDQLNSSLSLPVFFNLVVATPVGIMKPLEGVVVMETFQSLYNPAQSLLSPKESHMQVLHGVVAKILELGGNGDRHGP